MCARAANVRGHTKTYYTDRYFPEITFSDFPNYGNFEIETMHEKRVFFSLTTFTASEKVKISLDGY